MEIDLPPPGPGSARPTRRTALAFGIGALALALPIGLPVRAGAAAGRFYLSAAEEAVLTAAVDRLLPRDDWPSASEAGVVDFLDYQLATAWGQGEGLFRQGPHAIGTETQGYQLPHTPAELYREGLAAFAAQPELAGFAQSGPEAQDALLRQLEKDEIRLGAIPGSTFFRTLRGDTLAGYFSDPIHNGNRDLVGWRMLGFPGAHAYYLTEVDRFDLDYRRPPSGVAWRPGAGEPAPLRRPATGAQ